MADFDWKAFDLSKWWRAVTAAGVGISLAAIAAKYPPAILIGLGLLSFGSGEWIQHPGVTLPASSYGLPHGIVTTHERRLGPLGLMLDGLGAVLFVAGVVKLLLA
jgi:hypothetical protein